MILVPQNRGVLVNDLDLILMLDDANSMTFTNKKSVADHLKLFYKEFYK